MNKGNVVVKSGLWYTISNFLTKGILFISTPIFTRILSEEEFGAFSNISSWLNILVIVVTLNVEASLISARYDYEKQIDGYVFSALSLSTVSTIIWAVLFNIFMTPISTFFEIEPTYINCMFVYLLFFPALQLFQTQERFFFRYKSSVAISMLSTFGSCLLSVLLIVVMSNKLAGRVFGHIIPVAIVGLVLYIIIAKKGKKINFGVWKYAFKICLPYVPHLLSITVLNSTDRIMITKMCGEADNALYSVAYSVAMIVTLLITALNGAFSPWLAERLNKNDFDSIRSVSKKYIGIFILFGVGLMLIAPEVLYIMGGKEYMSAKAIMIPIALGCMCQFLYTMFVNIEQFYKKTLGMAMASISAALLNYLLNLWLIPKFGYVAAAYTTLVGYLWLLFIHAALVRIMKKHKAYSYTFVFVVLAGLGAVSAGMSFLYENFIIRYVFIALYLTALVFLGWKYRRAIKNILKK